MSFPSLPRLDFETPIAQTSDLSRKRPTAILEARGNILVPDHVRRFAEMINHMTTGDPPPDPDPPVIRVPLGRGWALEDSG